jgi:hypothetical protein
MEIKRTTDIFVRTKRRFTICQPESAEQVICPQCAKPMIAAEQLAVVSGFGCRVVYRLIEQGAAHFVETPEGAVLICPSSLLPAVDGDSNQPFETSIRKISDTREKNEK